MESRNCPNCGAIIEAGKDKCPYCGTSYFDISAIPFDKPFFLTLLTKDGQKITAKVVTTGATVETNSQDFYGGIGNELVGSYCHVSTLNLEFDLLN